MDETLPHDARVVVARRVGRRVAGGARVRRPAAADAVEHARGAARGRLLHARARRAPGRRVGPRAARGEPAHDHAARGAAAVAGVGGAAAPRDAGDRRRDLRVRRGAAAATGEPPGRAPARPPRRAPRRRRCGRVGPRRPAGGTRPRDHRARYGAARRQRDLPRRRRPLGGAARRVPTGRAAARAAARHRPQRDAARRGASRVAAAHSRAEPRDQQLARADQDDRRQPAPPRARGARAGGARGARTGERADGVRRRRRVRHVGRRLHARTRRRRRASGRARPVHRRVRAALAAAAAAEARRRRRRVGASRRGARAARHRARRRRTERARERRPRSARPAAHQRRAERGRRVDSRPAAAASTCGGRSRRRSSA